MIKVFFGIATSIPCIAIIFIFDPTAAELLLTLIMVLVATTLTWRLAKIDNGKQYEKQALFAKNPKPQIKALFKPAHEFIAHLKNSDQDKELHKMNADAFINNLNVLSNKLDWYQSNRKQYKATILISDLRGFSSISETYNADEIVSLLNRYFEQMSIIIYRQHGTIDKLMGDSILAVFENSGTSDEGAMNAVCCAAEMQIAMYKFNRKNQQLGMPAIYMGIGINSGEVVASKLGSELYNEQTIIGSDVNLAARIESYTVRGQILISDSTYQKTKNSIEVGESMQVIVKGKREAVTMYELSSVNEPQYLKIPEREIRRSPRVDVNIPFKFHVCEGKIITSEQNIGHISNISTGGMFAYTNIKVEPYFFIRFTLDFNVLGIECNDIYGKVLRVIKKDDQYELSIEFTIIDSDDRQSIQDLVNSTLAGMQRSQQQKPLV